MTISKIKTLILLLLLVNINASAQDDDNEMKYRGAKTDKELNVLQYDVSFKIPKGFGYHLEYSEMDDDSDQGNDPFYIEEKNQIYSFLNIKNFDPIEIFISKDSTNRFEDNRLRIVIGDFKTVFPPLSENLDVDENSETKEIQKNILSTLRKSGMEILKIQSKKGDIIGINLEYVNLYFFFEGDLTYLFEVNLEDLKYYKPIIASFKNTNLADKRKEYNEKVKSE